MITHITYSFVLPLRSWKGDALSRHTEWECSFVIDGGDEEVSLCNDIHADKHIVVEFTVVLAAENPQIGYFVAVLKAEVNEVGIDIDDAIQGGDCVLFARFKPPERWLSQV